jgi:hypothetical protein
MTTPETSNGPRGPKASSGLRPVLATVTSLGFVGVALSFALDGPRCALGVAAGAGLAIANLWALGLLGSRLSATTGSKAPWVALAFGKLVILFTAVFCLLSLGVVGPLELALGYLAMPVGITLSYVVFRDPGLDSNRESA